MDYSEEGRGFARIYEVTGSFRDGKDMPRQIVTASSRRDAILQVMRELGSSMNRLALIDAEAV